MFEACKTEINMFYVTMKIKGRLKNLLSFVSNMNESSWYHYITALLPIIARYKLSPDRIQIEIT